VFKIVISLSVATGSISEYNTTEFAMHRSYDADPTKDRCHYYSIFHPTEGERLSLPCWLIRYPGSKATHCLRSSELTGLNVKQVLLVCTAPYHTHARAFNGPFSGTTRVSRYQKGKTNLDFTEARGSEWQWHQLGHMRLHLAPDR